MTLLVVATYPVAGGPVLEGPVTIEPDGGIAIGGVRVPSSQGTSAMLGAAVQVAAYLGTPAPHALVAGDIGRGDGTRAVYEHLLGAVERIRPSVLAFHYMQPVMALMRKAVEGLAQLAPDML
ncbi:MAG: sugar kinase, partial [Coriobacteriia bacterium]|nr:sugar kinase [Coriobacteriia bacterium]